MLCTEAHSGAGSEACRAGARLTAPTNSLGIIREGSRISETLDRLLLPTHSRFELRPCFGRRRARLDEAVPLCSTVAKTRTAPFLSSTVPPSWRRCWERRAHSAAAKKQEKQERMLPKGLQGTRLRRSIRAHPRRSRTQDGQTSVNLLCRGGCLPLHSRSAAILYSGGRWGAQAGVAGACCPLAHLPKPSPSPCCPQKRNMTGGAGNSLVSTMPTGAENPVRELPREGKKVQEGAQGTRELHVILQIPPPFRGSVFSGTDSPAGSPHPLPPPAPSSLRGFPRGEPPLPCGGSGSKRALCIIPVLRRALLPRQPQREQGLPHHQRVHQLLPVAASC